MATRYSEKQMSEFHRHLDAGNSVRKSAAAAGINHNTAILKARAYRKLNPDATYSKNATTPAVDKPTPKPVRKAKAKPAPAPAPQPQSDAHSELFIAVTQFINALSDVACAFQKLMPQTPPTPPKAREQAEAEAWVEEQFARHSEDDDIDDEEVDLEEIAVMVVQGEKHHFIADSCGLTRHELTRVMKTAEYQEMLAEVKRGMNGDFSEPF